MPVRVEEREGGPTARPIRAHVVGTAPHAGPVVWVEAGLRVQGSLKPHVPRERGVDVRHPDDGRVVQRPPHVPAMCLLQPCRGPQRTCSKFQKKWRGMFLNFMNLITATPSRDNGDQVLKVDFFPIACP